MRVCVCVCVCVEDVRTDRIRSPWSPPHTPRGSGFEPAASTPPTSSRPGRPGPGADKRTLLSDACRCTRGPRVGRADGSPLAGVAGRKYGRLNKCLVIFRLPVSARCILNTRNQHSALGTNTRSKRPGKPGLRAPTAHSAARGPRGIPAGACLDLAPRAHAARRPARRGHNAVTMQCGQSCLGRRAPRMCGAPPGRPGAPRTVSSVTVCLGPEPKSRGCRAPPSAPPPPPPPPFLGPARPGWARSAWVGGRRAR